MTIFSPLLALLLSLQAPTTEQTLPATPDWIIGCWETQGGTQEKWIKMPGGILFGANTVMREGKLVFFEQLRIEPTPNGLLFAAYPVGKGPTLFMQVPAIGKQLTFINPQHDSPQVIQYEMTNSAETLSAIAMQLDGAGRQEWVYSRCEK